VRAGIAYSANGLMPDAHTLVSYPGKQATMSIAEPRICPPCLMLHPADLVLIAEDDDEDLFANLITRLARSALELRFSPAPHVLMPDFKLTPPTQQHLGYEAAPYWKDGVRWVGVGVKPSLTRPLLKATPTALGIGSPALPCAANTPAYIKTGSAKAYAIKADQDFESRIFTIEARHEAGESPIKVSLQQAPPKEAVAFHAEGRNLRSLKAGQNYKMRWGPIWNGKAMTLVVESKSAGTLRLDNPILTSRA
jgi:hypothetical protein